MLNGNEASLLVAANHTNHPSMGITSSLSPTSATNSLFFATQPVYNEDQIKEYVRHQIEYYFSNENLEHDLFLRRKMDPLGYIPLSVIASFNRVKQLSQDFQLIVSAVQKSDTLEVLLTAGLSGNKDDYLVRCKLNPTKWPLEPQTSAQLAAENLLLSQLNPNVAEFVPRFTSSSLPHSQQASFNEENNNNNNNTNSNINSNISNQIPEVKKSQPVTIAHTIHEPSGLENYLDRCMLSTSAPEREPIEWLKVQSKKEKFLLKKQKKLTDSATKTTVSTLTKATTTATSTTTSANKKHQKLPPKNASKSQSQANKSGHADDNRGELDFQFDEEINNNSSSTSSKTKQTNDDYDSQSQSDSDLDYDSDDEYDYDEMDDQAISKLVIITQSPPANRKNGAGPHLHLNDRTGDHIPRAKIVSELAKTINDGLFYYEQNLANKRASSAAADLIRSNSGCGEKTVDLVPHDQFKKLKQNQESSSRLLHSSASSSKSTASSRDSLIPLKTNTSKNNTSSVAISKDYSQAVQSSTSNKTSGLASADCTSSFVPHSLPNDTMPSFKQLMSHVNAIKSGAINFKPNQHSSSNKTSALKHASSESKRQTGNSSQHQADNMHRPSAKLSRFYPVIKEAKPLAPGTPHKRSTRHSDNPPIESHVGWVMDNSVSYPTAAVATSTSGRRDSVKQLGTTPGSSGRYRTNSTSCNGFTSGTTPIDEFINNMGSNYAQGQDLQPFQHPSYTLLHQNGFTQQLYGKFRKRCLAGLIYFLLFFAVLIINKIGLIN